MTTQTDILEASDPEQLLGNYTQVFNGFIRESLMLTRDFEPHLADYQPAVQEVINQLLPAGGLMTDDRRNLLISRIDGILWHSLAPIHRNLFDGREVDAFGLSGTLQRSVNNFSDQGFQAIAERIADLCHPLRMCEGSFEVEAVAPATFKLWAEDLVDLGIIDEITPEFEQRGMALASQVLSIAAPHLIKAVSDGITIPEEGELHEQ